MKKIFLTILFSFSAYSVAHAADTGLQGHWAGTGTWSFDGSGVDCQMQLAFTENSTSLNRAGGYFDCDVVGMKSEAATWTKQGQQLLVDGKVVGSIQPDQIQFTEQYNEQTQIVTTIKMHGSKFDYSEIWYDRAQDPSNQVLYDIEGNFERQ